MNRKVLIVYKSVTGFTRKYAELIAQELDGALLDLKKVSAETMSNYDIIIFGGRTYAGKVDGLKKAKEFFRQSKATKFIVYATGVIPNNMKDTIDEMWNNNLSSAEQLEIPHYYMQGGLRYEEMPLFDKWMIKSFGAMIKRKKDKNEYEIQIEKAISSSYDLSSKEFIMPLIAALESE